MSFKFCTGPFGPFGQDCTCSGRVRLQLGDKWMSQSRWHEMMPGSPLSNQVGPWWDLEGDWSSIACHFLHSRVSSSVVWMMASGLDSWIWCTQGWIPRCSIAHLKDILPGNTQKHCQHLGWETSSSKPLRWGQSLNSTNLFIWFWV